MRAFPYNLALVAEILEDASLLLLNARDTLSVRVVRHKLDGPVSTADLISQQLITNRLQDLAPDIPIVSEENSTGWQHKVEELVRQDGFLWILDPLDGTSSYLSGMDDYGIQLALMCGNKIVGGWIHCPSRGWKVQAWDGIEGLYISGLESIGVPVPTSLDMVRAVIASGDFGTAHRQQVNNLHPKLASVRGTRSCAIDYVELITGRQDLLLYRRSLPWDHAPGIYLAHRAGASVRRYDGRAYQIHDGLGGLIVVRCAELQTYQHYFLPPTPT